MTTLATKLYALSENGGSPSVSVNDIGNVLGSTASPATTTTLGVVKQSATVSASAVTVPTAAPAGGTGTAAGGWDTAVDRDAAITTINGLVTAAADYKTKINAIIAALQAAGIMA